MDQKLQKMCEDFIAYRDEVKKAFKLELDTVMPICADIFLSHHQRPDEARLRACKEYIKDHAGVFNNFRGSMFAPAAALLACSPDPAKKMEQASMYYKLLKEYFPPSDQLVLSALLLTDMAAAGTAREKAERGRAIYELMKEKHRVLTGSEDSVFAVLMAFSDKSDEEMIGESEACFEALKGMGPKDYLQMVAEILAMSDRPAAEKCARFKELFESIRAAGMKYGRNYELTVLAALSVSDIGIPRLVSDIAGVSDWLKAQKGYKGFFGADQRMRLMHAAMLVNTYYSPAVGGDVAAISAMLGAIAVYMMVIMCVTMSSITVSTISAG